MNYSVLLNALALLQKWGIVSFGRHKKIPAVFAGIK